MELPTFATYFVSRSGDTDLSDVRSGGWGGGEFRMLYRENHQISIKGVISKTKFNTSWNKPFEDIIPKLIAVSIEAIARYRQHVM